MFLTISFANAIGSNSENGAEKKESPLFKIRGGRSIGQKLRGIAETIKTKFLGERIFFKFNLKEGFPLLRSTFTCFDTINSICCPVTCKPKCEY